MFRSLLMLAIALSLSACGYLGDKLDAARERRWDAEQAERDAQDQQRQAEREQRLQQERAKADASYQAEKAKEEAAYAKAIAARDPYTICTAIGTAYQNAAGDRDQGLTPQVSFAEIKSLYNTKYEVIPDKRIKSIVNEVYFDFRFHDAGGIPLFTQMRDVCLGTYKPMQPLK